VKLPGRANNPPRRGHSISKGRNSVFQVAINEMEEMSMRAFKIGLATIAMLVSSGRAAVIWNQSSNGPLSENPLAPTSFTLSAGTNSVIAVVGGGGGSESGIDQNWVNMNIPAGLQLSNLVLASFVSTDLQGFTGVAAGATFAGGEGAVNTTSSYLGYTHFGTGASDNGHPAQNLVGVDVLPIMGNNLVDSPGSQGFTPPLPAGSYTFLIQQMGATTNYQYDFDVTAVPEPASLSVLGFGAVGLLMRRSRRRA
jgi:hypothetical protein